MIDHTLIVDLQRVVDAIQTALDRAVTLRNSAPYGEKTPYRRTVRRLNRAGDTLTNMLEELESNDA